MKKPAPKKQTKRAVSGYNQRRKGKFHVYPYRKLWPAPRVAA